MASYLWLLGAATASGSVLHAAAGALALPLLRRAGALLKAEGELRLVPQLAHLAPSQMLCRLGGWEENCKPDDASEPHWIDWASTEQILGAADYGAQPDLQMYPVGATAVVPIYNLPSLAASDELVLAPDVLSDIFRGVITHWDDPRIAATNTDLELAGKLPSMNIKVIVRADEDGSTALLKKTLRSVDPEGFGRQIEESSAPAWNGTAVNLCVSGTAGTVPCVLVTPYAIGYSGLEEVLRLSLPAISILKPGTGVAVAASVASVEAALSEFGAAYGNNGDDPSHLTFDIHNGETPSAWPFSGVSYVVMRKSSSHPTDELRCHRRRDSVLFLRWMLIESHLGVSVRDLGFAMLPPHERELIYLRAEAEILCDGVPAVEPEGAPSTISWAGPSWFSSFMGSHTTVYTAGIAHYLPLGLEGVSAGLADESVDIGFGLYVDGHMSGGELHTLPFAGVAIAVAFSFCGSDQDGCQLANRTMSLDVPTIAAITDGNLTRWLDPRLVSLNPWMAIEPFASIIGLSREIIVVGTEVGSATNQALLAHLQKYGSNANLDAFESGGHAVRQATDQMVVEVVAATAFSIGLVALTEGSWREMVSFASVLSPYNSSLAIAPTASTMRSCGTAEDGRRYWNLSAYQVPDCYPLTAVVGIMINRDHAGTNCSRATAALLFAQWVIEQSLASVEEGELLLLVSRAQHLIDDWLYGVECEGDSLLALRNDLGFVSTWVKVIIIISGVFGMCLLGIAAVVLVWNRKSNTVKKAQPLFLCLMLCGLALIFCSGMLSAQDHEGADPDTSVPAGQPGRYPKLDIGCQAQVWLYFLGTSLTYSSLVLKLWRITIVLVNPSLREVKVRSTYFLKYVVASLVTDAGLLVAWAFMAAPFYRVDVVLQDGIEVWRGSCEMFPQGSAPFAIALIVKDVLIVLFGIFLCYQSRNVRSQYSEGKAMLFVLIVHFQQTVASVMMGWVVYPFRSTGSPMGFLLVKWLMPSFASAMAMVFIVGARLVMLSSEHRIASDVVLASPSRLGSVKLGSSYNKESARGKNTDATGGCVRGSSMRSTDPSGNGKDASEPHDLTSSNMADDETDAEAAAVSKGKHRRGKGAIPRATNERDARRIESLLLALSEAQAALRISEEELADAREDNTELRDRNNTLLNQLEDVRTQRDAFFFDNVLEGKDEDASR